MATALRLRNPEAEEAPVDNRLLGESPPMRALRNQIGKLARSQAPVYISGESGSGKELVARLIHEQGPRIERPFVPVNCGAIPSELMESEFFGHKKGSFTGAIEDKQGLFQAASGGTLFLDEVADLPMAMQVKLLRRSRKRPCARSAASRRSPSTCASSAPPTRTSPPKSAPGASARPLLPPQRHRACAYRRCANAARTSRCSPIASSSAWPATPACRPPG